MATFPTNPKRKAHDITCAQQDLLETDKHIPSGPGFGESCKDVKIAKTILSAECKDSHGEWHKTSVDTSEFMFHEGAILLADNYKQITISAIVVVNWSAKVTQV